MYIAVLGTSLIVSLLALSALMLQRLENQKLAAAADIEQARLNARAAVELALLYMEQNADWRDTLALSAWFANRSTGAGSYTLEVVDPADGDVANDPDDPVVLVGIGSSGRAEQRVSLTVDPQRQPLDCLHSTVATSGAINLAYDTLRASGTITANSVSASSSQVYGDVEAVSISGSTYNGTTTQIEADELPTMPDWDALITEYQSIGTSIDVNNLPTETPNLGRNVGIENGAAYWTGNPIPGIVPSATVTQSSTYKRNGTYSLKVEDREEYWSGACQPVDHLVEASASFYVEAWVYHRYSSSVSFIVTLYTKGSGAQSNTAGPSVLVPSGTWTLVRGTLSVPSWSGSLQSAFIKIAGITGQSGNRTTFYVDDLLIRKLGADRYIYRQVLGPGLNPFGGGTNPRGVYWIDCGGNRLSIERSRIRGTLVLLNLGTSSSINAGPIHMSPAVAGYPALVVNGDFTMAATNRVLSEQENGVNYNPPGVAHDQLEAEGIPDDIYPSEIDGLVVVRNSLFYRNSPLIRGQLIVGGDICDSSGSLEVEYQADSLLAPPPGFVAPQAYERRPGSIRKMVLP